ncbi:MAG: molybdopterin biosynthesis protein MoeB [Deltaproteobacteria bacterium]|nr:MAG: molybdopterin biosynthesis protein MoeB [Deltaproteobacteria bacterium]PIE72132.1 MAG: molybdopterin biosynthesis protein MoeB [Deltaproteobacteria bacterium]
MSDSIEFFSRNLQSISSKQQQLLRQKQVSVVGCGGLGGYVIEQLVRLGVGRIHCFDPDVFSVSNGNRQLYATSATLGKSKAESAAKRAAAIHDYCEVVPFALDYRKAPAEAVFQVDVVVDCLDDVAVRLELSAACRRQKKMLVHGSVSGWVGQVGVQLPGGRLYEKLYPAPRHRPDEALSVLACTVGLIASLQVSETIKILLDLPPSLAETALFVDLHKQEFVRMG